MKNLIGKLLGGRVSQMARHKWYTTKKVALGGAKKKMSGWLGFGTHNARHVVMQFHRVTDCHEKSATLSCDNSTSLGLQLAIRAQNCATIELPRNLDFGITGQLNVE